MAFSLPLIALGTGAPSAEALNNLRKACLEHGFLLLSNERPEGGYHIAPERIERMWRVAAELFDAPLAAKQAVSVASSLNNRGYFSSLDHAEFNRDPNGVVLKDNKEGFFFGSDTLIAPGNRVPQGCEHLLVEVEAYMEDARQACLCVMRAIVQTGLLENLASDELDPDTFVSRFLADPVYMLKALKYPPTDGNTDAHTDYGCITLLLPGDEGLQVYYGGAFCPVPLTPGAFVINFGDLLAMWSGGRVRSTIHRVIYNSPRGTPRYSIPFFMHPSRGSTINCGHGKPPIDSYSYVLDRFDKTYKHRQQQQQQQQQEAAEAHA